MPNSEIDLDAIRQRAEAATPGPWWDDSDEHCWRLHGVHASIPVTLGGVTIDQVVNHQIIKAPKRNTPYAEYRPNEADAAFIRHAREDVPALLAEIDRLRMVEAAFVRASTGQCNGGPPLWRHSCGHVEAMTDDWQPEDGGCDACESGSDDPTEWEPLYLRRAITRPNVIESGATATRPNAESGR